MKKQRAHRTRRRWQEKTAGSGIRTRNCQAFCGVEAPRCHHGPAAKTSRVGVATLQARRVDGACPRYPGLQGRMRHGRGLESCSCQSSFLNELRLRSRHPREDCVFALTNNPTPGDNVVETARLHGANTEQVKDQCECLSGERFGRQVVSLSTWSRFDLGRITAMHVAIYEVPNTR